MIKRFKSQYQEYQDLIKWHDTEYAEEIDKYFDKIIEKKSEKIQKNKKYFRKIFD